MDYSRQIMCKNRKIIHIDMDCFYASIEMRDYPEFATEPLAVGGDPHKRGVIATCNYLARQYGIHSAMATAHALKLCPNLVLRPVRMEVYRHESLLIRKIFAEYTDIIEPLSLDEAFLDVTDSTQRQGSATWIAEAIRRQIYDSRQLTASAGIAPNKSLAKIASDWNKPNGQMVITPDNIEPFMLNLSVRKLFGVGPVMEEKLNLLGIKTCEQLQSLTQSALIALFGITGKRLYELSRGIDNRPVDPNRIRKSISVEKTYSHDLPDLQACLNEIPGLIEKLSQRLNALIEIPPFQSSFVKLKFIDFQHTTVERLSHHLDVHTILEMITEGWYRKSIPIRLLGLGVRFRYQNKMQEIQLTLPGIEH